MLGMKSEGGTGGGLKGDGFFFFLGMNLREDVVEEVSRDTKNFSSPDSIIPSVFLFNDNSLT
jgi:hypothetical protein